MDETKGRSSFNTPGIQAVQELTARLMDSNRELGEANRLLRESEEARSKMLADISHDLRAPLSAIRGALDRLKSCETSELPTLVSVIDRRVSALEHLIGELYFSVSLEQPGFVLNLSPCEVAPFLEEYFITQQTDGRFSRRRTLLSIPEDFNSKLLLDPERMVRVLDNLVSNALRFTREDDEIELGCRLSGDLVEIYLRDGGIGVAPEAIPHIFDRMYTSSSARTPSANGGSGLGLYISRTIVQKHGGELRCESAPEMGATFTVSLPALT